MSTYEPYYAARNALVGDLERDTVGPAGGEREVILDLPLDRYVAGVLYPKVELTVDPDQDMDEAEGDKDVAPDPPVAMANVRYPQSMGLTFAVDTALAYEISAAVAVGKYE